VKHWSVVAFTAFAQCSFSDIFNPDTNSNSQRRGRAQPVTRTAATAIAFIRYIDEHATTGEALPSSRQFGRLGPIYIHTHSFNCPLSFSRDRTRCHYHPRPLHHDIVITVSTGNFSHSLCITLEEAAGGTDSLAGQNHTFTQQPRKRTTLTQGDLHTAIASKEPAFLAGATVFDLRPRGPRQKSPREPCI
jgi:hypothetical protein